MDLRRKTDFDPLSISKKNLVDLNRIFEASDHVAMNSFKHFSGPKKGPPRTALA